VEGGLAVPEWLVYNPGRRQPALVYELLEHVAFITESRRKPTAQTFTVRPSLKRASRPFFRAVVARPKASLQLTYPGRSVCV
jgi:hypothetical protein